MPEYILADSSTEYEAAARLFQEYADWLGIDLSFQHFEEELTAIKKMYAAPHGGIILCKNEAAWIGCIAVRRFEENIGELKRMYVQPAFQGKGIGKALLERALQLAEKCGYKKVYLDTLNTMTPAMNLYKQAGFVERTAYYHNPHENVVYFEKEL